MNVQCAMMRTCAWGQVGRADEVPELYWHGRQSERALARTVNGGRVAVG